MKRIGMNKPKKRDSRRHLCPPGMEGVWSCHLYKHRHTAYLRQLISYSTQHQSHSHYSILYIVVKYKCLTYIRIHYLKPLSDGSKKPNERTIGTSRTSYTYRCAQTIVVPLSNFVTFEFPRVLIFLPDITRDHFLFHNLDICFKYTYYHSISHI